jgi:hypothetical protein
VSNEERLSEWGFEQVFANMEASLADFPTRIRKSKIAGGAPSAWLASTEFNFGKDLVADFTGCAGLVWSGREKTPEQRWEDLARLMPDIRRNVGGLDPPSATDPSSPIDLRRQFNAGVPGLAGPKWKSGRISRADMTFDLGDPALNGGKYAVVVGSQGQGDNPYARQSEAIPIGIDASSLLFLHALAQPAASVQGYEKIYDFEDSADLAGWYEVEYEDGLITTIPLRYKWNILDTKNQAREVAYKADSITCGDGARFYAFEWLNPRLGIAIRQVRLVGSLSFKNPEGKEIPSNAIILAGVSVVAKREKPKRQDPPFPK